MHLLCFRFSAALFTTNCIENSQCENGPWFFVVVTIIGLAISLFFLVTSSTPEVSFFNGALQVVSLHFQISESSSLPQLARSVRLSWLISKLMPCHSGVDHGVLHILISRRNAAIRHFFQKLFQFSSLLKRQRRGTLFVSINDYQGHYCHSNQYLRHHRIRFLGFGLLLAAFQDACSSLCREASVFE
jgi:hypothetical protein